MAVFFSLLRHLVIGWIFIINVSGQQEDAPTAIVELKQIQTLLADDLSALKRKVYVDILVKLDFMQEALSKHRQCNCTPLASPITGNEQSNNVTLYNAFVDEKKTSRKAISQISEMRYDLHKVENLTKVLASNGTAALRALQGKVIKDKKVMFETVLQLRAELEELTNRVHRIEAKAAKFEGVFKSTEEMEVRLTDHLHKVSRSNMDDEAIKSKLKSFRQPSFTSDWTLMKSQDSQLSNLSFKHGLNDIPYKVEVQIRPDDGVNSNWLFHGDTVFQSDDDRSIPYGGIVYLYNDKTVDLIAPKRANDGAQGVVINTGDSGFFRLGNYHQMSQRAYVRVKVWAPVDFPKPDFLSNWKPLEIKDSNLSYYEIEHGLNDYPAFVNVQVRCKLGDSFVISEGVGASMENSGAWPTSGGVVWAFNDIHIRVWTAFQRPDWTEDRVAFPYLLLGAIDGWNYPANYDNYKGEFRILAWSKASTVVGRNFVSSEPKSESLATFSPNSDLLSFYVQCEEGENLGFRFKGYGNSQTVSSPFGGAVYAFRQNDGIRVWKPNPEKGGFLVHVHSPYGNGRKTQATNNATFVVEILKGSK